MEQIEDEKHIGESVAAHERKLEGHHTEYRAVHGDAPALTCHQLRLLHVGIEVEIC